MEIACACLVAAASLCSLAVQSQPPAPGGGKGESSPPQQQPQPNQQQPPVMQRGSEQLPVVVRVLPTPKSQSETDQEQRDRESEASAKRWTIWLTVLTVLVAFGQLWVILRQNRIIHGQSEIMREQADHMRDGLTETRRASTTAEVSAESARDYAEKQTAVMRAQLLATKQTADAATDSANVAKNALHTVERAYVSLSHSAFDFVHVDDERDEHYGFRPWTEIKISNTGRTPATITDVRLTSGLSSEPLPDIPPYGTHVIEQTVTFLASNDFFNLTPELDVIPDAHWKAIQQGKVRLFLIGYVDYIDRFGNRHRAGYGRVYDPTHRTLTFIRKSGYNYDRERNHGEGNDWDEPQ